MNITFYFDVREKGGTIWIICLGIGGTKIRKKNSILIRSEVKFYEK